MKGKTMRVEAANDENSTRGWLLCDERRRVLDVFYTDYGTKVFVEDGVLIEQKMESLQTKPSASVNGMVPISDFHSPPESPQQTLEEEAEALRSHKEQTVSLANAALCHYNSKHRTLYELVDPIISSASLWSGGLWYHCNFTAKHETHRDSSARRFFAELKEGGQYGNEYSVTACRPIDDIKTTKGCEMCGSTGGRLEHPTRGFRQGLYSFKPRNLRRRTNGKVL